MSTPCWGPAPSATCSRTRPPKPLVNAIRKVAGGEVYLSPEINTGLVRRYVRKQPADRGSASPSPCPTASEVLQLIAEGASSKEISTCRP
ncbi:MAG: hypothetical protein U1F87_09085 [Kiritimatiellia bacterium]